MNIFRSNLRRIVTGALMVVALTTMGARAASSQLHLLDLSGHPADPLSNSTEKAQVFVFTRTDCPISNRYAPLLNQIFQKYTSQGVAFWLVYVDPSQGPDAIEKHMREFDYHFGVLRDPDHTLVKLTGAQVTPEAAVFVPEKSGARLVYRGRIDDQYVKFGVTRPKPTTHDLEQVLQEILAGKPVKESTSRAVGCFISDLK
jgi:AhpC/TSA family